MKNLLHFLLITFLVFITEAVTAQEVPVLSQSIYGNFLYNPAIGNTSDNYNSLQVINRSSIYNENSTQYSMINYSGISGKKKLSYNFLLTNEYDNIVNKTALTINYSAGVKLAEDTYIRLGTNIGLNYSNMNMKNVIIDDQDDQWLIDNFNSKLFFDFNPGLMLQIKDFGFGVALKHFFMQSLTGDVTIDFQQALVANADYTFHLDDASLVINNIVEYTNNQYWDITTKLLYKNHMGWLGGGFGTEAGMGLEMGLNLNPSLQMIYALNNGTNLYEFSTPKVHEFGIVYRFNGKNNSRSKSYKKKRRSSSKSKKTISNSEQKMINEQSQALSTQASISKEDLKNQVKVVSSSNQAEGYYIVTHLTKNKNHADQLLLQLRAKNFDANTINVNGQIGIYIANDTDFDNIYGLYTSQINGSYNGEYNIYEIKLN